MKVEECTCEGCGYRYKMPELSLFKDIPMGTFDYASWAYCCPECMSVHCEHGLYEKLPFKAKLLRRIFRWKQFRHYARVLRRPRA